MLNALCRIILLALAVAIIILPHEVCAQNAISIGSFRETIESPHSSGSNSVSKPIGKITLRKQGSKQLFDVEVRNLNSTAYSVWLDPNPTFQINDPVSLLCLLNHSGATSETFQAKLQATDTAPQFLFVTVSNLDDLTNQVICIGPPTIGTTNTIVPCVLWAPISELLAKPNQLSFKKLAPLTIPVPPVINGQLWVPDPKASGKIKLQQSGTTGQSRIEVDAENLLIGHTYSVWMTLSTLDDPDYPSCITNDTSSCLVLLDQLTQKESGKIGSYIRDTAVGDSLPQQFPHASDLSNHLLIIEDEANLIYLTGVIP